MIIQTSETAGIKIHKKELAGRYDFREAQEAVTAVLDFDDTSFRCPTRRECLDIYDAGFQGLDEALEVIGGDKLDDNYIWTCESDTDPEYSSNSAFVFGGYGGGLNNFTKSYSTSVRPVTALQFVK